MLSLDVRAVAQHAAAVAGELEPTDPVWESDDLRPTTPIRVTGRVSSAGGGRYYWSGHIDGLAEQVCRRCLDSVQVKVSEDVRALFAEPGAEGDDDPDVYTVEPGSGTIDLRPAVREHWLLDVPKFALCRDDCKGLCPTCGENRNKVKCECAPVSDSRWDSLRSVRRD